MFICSEDCDVWFDVCKDDFICLDNWGDFKIWNWISGMCKLECKIFKEYFDNVKIFCEKFFNYLWKYIKGELGIDCMILWLNGIINFNKRVVCKYVEDMFFMKLLGLKVVV